MNGRIVAALLGVGLFIAWTQLGGSSGGPLSPDSTPETVLGGGGGRLEVRLTTNQPAVLVSGFSRYDEATNEETSVDGREEFAPGSHIRAIDVSPDTYIYLELGVPDATPGAEVSWSITIDGRPVTEASDRLEEALRSGYAFFLQFEADDVAQVRAWAR
jgi:hypothetical protein